ncbi:glutathione S-transferase 3-like [Chanodichthys erythropterus]|uniref:glutathione S-transferase 3-like n=1 Tax=Chanodichthys erythropterus TaxID=933992 RepID=UPI00351ECDC1
MSGKVVLHYFDGRGKMESIQWILAAAGVEFEEVFLTKREHYDKLLNDGALMFQQVPLVEIDGMQLVQTKAILNYIAGKYNLYGKDIKERALIDMYSEGILNLMDLIMLYYFFSEDKQKQLSDIEQKAKERFMPVFEKAFQERMKALPKISKFLQPGSARKPPPDEVYVKTVKEVLSHLFK